VVGLDFKEFRRGRTEIEEETLYGATVKMRGRGEK
jgi:hypothetical protein